MCYYCCYYSCMSCYYSIVNTSISALIMTLNNYNRNVYSLYYTFSPKYECFSGDDIKLLPLNFTILIWSCISLCFQRGQQVGRLYFSLCLRHAVRLSYSSTFLNSPHLSQREVSSSCFSLCRGKRVNSQWCQWIDWKQQASSELTPGVLLCPLVQWRLSTSDVSMTANC